LNSKRDITIYDIARKMDISTATVSRALNNSPAISEKTRLKIQETAKEMGYRHNSFAKNLRKQNSHTIGVIIHELVSSFTTSVLGGIEKVISAAGYDIIIAHSSEEMAKEIKNANNLFHKRVDGVIASLAYDTNDLSHFEPFNQRNIPLVFFDRVEENIESIKIVIDNYKAGYQATKHLIDQGCKRIAIVTGTQKRNVYAQRYRGYKDALADNGLPLNEAYVIFSDLSEESGADAANLFAKMDPRPDAAFMTNDMTAAIFMKALKKYDISVPEDIAVVGFNNDDISKIVEPELTTIDYPGFLMGEVAANQLINHLQGNVNVKQLSTIILNSELIIRKSSLKSGKI
jgi:LacI family transcriptional regulator